MGNTQFAHEIPIIPGYTAYLPTVIAQSNVESHTGDAETIVVTGSEIVVPKGVFSPGTTFRFTVAGNRTGTAGAATFLIVINSTTAISLAIPTNTAVDYKGVFTVSEYSNFAHQHCTAQIDTSATVLSAFDYAAATVNVSEETTIEMKVTLANASDDIYVEYVLVECWNVPE